MQSNDFTLIRKCPFKDCFCAYFLVVLCYVLSLCKCLLFVCKDSLVYPLLWNTIFSSQWNKINRINNSLCYLLSKLLRKLPYHCVACVLQVVPVSDLRTSTVAWLAKRSFWYQQRFKRILTIVSIAYSLKILEKGNLSLLRLIYINRSFCVG